MSSRPVWCWRRWWRPGRSEIASRTANRCGTARSITRPPSYRDTPWSVVLSPRQIAQRSRSATRHGSSALARALEEVTLRAAGDEDLFDPYPGPGRPSPQEDAKYFFGRELEVEALWKKLRRPHLLAVIGPSGAGKSSFLRAGLHPHPCPTAGRRSMATPG